jgi:hypothetical protein
MVGTTALLPRLPVLSTSNVALVDLNEYGELDRLVGFDRRQ